MTRLTEDQLREDLRRQVWRIQQVWSSLHAEVEHGGMFPIYLDEKAELLEDAVRRIREISEHCELMHWPREEELSELSKNIT